MHINLNLNTCQYKGTIVIIFKRVKSRVKMFGRSKASQNDVVIYL